MWSGTRLLTCAPLYIIDSVFNNLSGNQKCGLWRNKIEKSIDAFELQELEKTPDNNIDSQDNKQMNKWTTQLRDLTQDTNEQTQIIPLPTHYAKTISLEKALILGKGKVGGKRRREPPAGTWMDNGIECTIGKPERPTRMEKLNR